MVTRTLEFRPSGALKAKIEAIKNTPVKVLITGDHPHAGRAGTIEVTDGKAERHMLPGYGDDGAYKIRFDEPDEFGTEACFASKRNISITVIARPSYLDAVQGFIKS